MGNSWYVYIAVDKTSLFTGICNDLIQEEILLKEESESNTISIKWFQECNSKLNGLNKLKEINNLTDDDKFLILDKFNSIIILKDDDYKENYEKFPSVYNLKQTLQLSDYLKQIPEIWKLDNFYIEHVAEYLSIKTTQIEFFKLWNISMDFSTNVGLVTKEKFFPIIKY